MLAIWCVAELTSWALFVPMAISSVGNGLSQPPEIAATLGVYPRIAGAASGLLGFLQMMTAAVGTFLIGQLPQTSALSMVLVVGASLALAWLFGLLAFASRSTAIGSGGAARPLRLRAAGDAGAYCISPFPQGMRIIVAGAVHRRVPITTGANKP
jgi:hypothetical protein